MNWNTYNNLLANAVPALGNQALSSVSTFAIWDDLNAQPPQWPENEQQFNQLNFGQRLKQSVVIVGLNPSGPDPGPSWGNYHVLHGNDYRLATALRLDGPLQALNGAYMTDLLKTIPGPRIDVHHVPQEILETNARLFEQELNIINFGGHHLPVLIFLGDKSEWMFDQIVEKTNLVVPSHIHYWIYHHSARIADARRNQRHNRVAGWLNRLLLSHNLADFP
jgi:hypothetical protein